MTKIDNNELKTINGGGLGIGAWLAIASAVTFIIGVIDGYVRPLACN